MRRKHTVPLFLPSYFVSFLSLSPSFSFPLFSLPPWVFISSNRKENREIIRGDDTSPPPCHWITERRQGTMTVERLGRGPQGFPSKTLLLLRSQTGMRNKRSFLKIPSTLENYNLTRNVTNCKLTPNFQKDCKLAPEFSNTANWLPIFNLCPIVISPTLFMISLSFSLFQLLINFLSLFFSV